MFLFNPRTAKVLYIIFVMITPTTANINSDENKINNTLEEDYAVMKLSPEFVNSSQPDSNLTFDTVVERVASPIDIYYTPCLIIFGISGNMICLYVFVTSKLKYQSTSKYLSALAVSDAIFLAELLPPWMSTMGISDLFHKDPYCKGFIYVSYVSCSLSSWLVIAFTLERLMAILYPFHRHSICTTKRARYITCAIVIGAMIVNVPVIHFAGSENQVCQIPREKIPQAAIFNWVDTTMTFTIPLLLIIICNTWIAGLVYKLERDRMKLTQDDLQASSASQTSRDSDFNSPRCQRRITKLLLTVSTMYVLLNCPAYALRICGYIYDMDSKEFDDKWMMAQNIATMLFNTNFGINFFLYCLIGQNFRQALVEKVPCVRWLERKTRRGRKRSALNQARACSVTPSAASMEMAIVNKNARRLRPRSGNYILRWTFDNNRRRRADAEAGASESIAMHDICSDLSRPGPSRVISGDRSRPGTSYARDLTDTSTRPDIEQIETAFEPRRRRPVRPQVIMVEKRKESNI